MTTYTSIARLPIQTPGDPAVRNSWGTILNAALPLIEQTAAGIAVIDLTGLTAYTLTTQNDAPDQARMAMLQFSGTPSATVTVTIPQVARVGWVSNSTTRSVILTCGGGGVVLTVPALASYLYTCDATNVSAVSLAAPASLSSPQGVTIGNNYNYSAIDTGGTARPLLGIGAGNHTNLRSGTTTGLQIVTSTGVLSASVTDSTGAWVFGAGISVPGSTSLSGTLGASGGVTFSSTLAVGGASSFSGSVTTTAGLTSTGFDVGGLQTRSVGGNYGAGWRNDGSALYLLVTPAGSPYGTFNALRPLAVTLSTGAVALDSTGAGVTCGGNVTVTGTVTAAALRGGPVSGSTGAFTAGVTATSFAASGGLAAASCTLSGALSAGAGGFTSLGVNGLAYSTAGLQSYGFDAGGIHMRCISANTFAGFRNDGSDFYILVNNATGTGTWSGTLPMHINLATSQVTLGTSGQQTNVAGPLAVTGTLTASGNTSRSFSGYAYSSSGPSGGSGSIGTSIIASNAVVGFGFYTASDRRAKTEIADIPWTDAARWVKQARPRTFTLDGAAAAGFIAQEDIEAGRGAAVQAIADPAPAYVDSDGVAPAGHRLIRDYQHDIAYLTACLQGLLQRVADLEAKLEAA